MPELKELFQEADWKKEKHVPVIDCPDQVNADEFFDVTVSIGKEVAHPNTTEHHIMWIALYFMGEGDKFPFEMANFTFSAHGQSPSGPNQGPAYTNHSGTIKIKLNKPGTLLASSYCNIHGLWEFSKQIKVQ